MGDSSSAVAADWSRAAEATGGEGLGNAEFGRRALDCEVGRRTLTSDFNYRIGKETPPSIGRAGFIGIPASLDSGLRDLYLGIQVWDFWRQAARI
ncbi:hypothetical protein SABR111722_17135 [Saccharibacillus brassicae]